MKYNSPNGIKGKQGVAMATYQVKLIDKQRAPEGTGLSQVNDQNTLDTAQFAVATRRRINITHTGVRVARHDIKGRIPQRQRDRQKQDRDMGLRSLARKDQVRDRHKDSK